MLQLIQLIVSIMMAGWWGRDSGGMLRVGGGV